MHLKNEYNILSVAEIVPLCNSQESKTEINHKIKYDF